MDYRWIGAFHLIAAVIWISGLLLLAIVAGIFAGKKPDRDGEQAFLSTVQAWNRKVTSPAMILLWIFGIVLMINSGTLSQPWLWVKLAILIGLSALHGSLSKKVRQVAGHEQINRGLITRYGRMAIILSVAVIILLAKFKTLFF